MSDLKNSDSFGFAKIFKIHLATHVWKVGPAVASGVTSFHILESVIKESVSLEWFYHYVRKKELNYHRDFLSLWPTYGVGACAMVLPDRPPRVETEGENWAGGCQQDNQDKLQHFL